MKNTIKNTEDSPLNHLDNSQIEELMDLYYNSEYTVAELLELFEIKEIRPSDLFRYFPEIVSDDLTCKYCKINLVQNRPSKSASWQKNDFYCPDCGHIENKNCSCQQCIVNRKNKEQSELQKKRNYLQNKIGFDRYEPIQIECLTFTQKVYLGAFLRAGITEDFEYIIPINEFSKKIAPTDEFEEEMFDELYFNKILQIHPKSNLKYFDVDYNNDKFTFQWKNIPFVVNIAGDSSLSNLINELLNPPLFESFMSEESLQIWKNIAISECLELFRFRMDVYGFDYKIGKETIGFFVSTIDKLPVSQIYSIIWNAAKNSAAYYQEGNVSRLQAANSTLSRLRNSLDKVLSGQWNRYDYTRPKECPQSVISEYYFNSIIKICDQGWYSKPVLLDLKNGN